MTHIVHGVNLAGSPEKVLSTEDLISTLPTYPDSKEFNDEETEEQYKMCRHCGQQCNGECLKEILLEYS